MEALQGWRSSEGELVLAMVTAELRALGGCCSEEERRLEAKWEHGRGSGGRWRG